MFGLFNVVWYDGCEAHLSKFILEQNGGKITPRAMGKIEKYINGNGEILKVDFRYTIDFDDIIEMNVSTASYDKLAINRFKKMYFNEEV